MNNPLETMNQDKLRDEIRLLAISEFPIKLENERFVGKAGEVFDELNRDGFRVVDYLVPRLQGWIRQYNRLRAYSRDKETWRRNISLSPRAFDLRTQQIERFIQQQREPFDLIFQMLAVFAPGTAYQQRHYVVCTDNTFYLTQRYWPEWAPKMSQATTDQWLERERELYQHAAYLFPWGKHAAQSMIHDYDVAPEKVVPIGMGSNLPSATAEMLAEHRYDNQLALFVGYEFKRKGGPTLLAAWAEVHQELPKARLIIAGPDKPEAPPMPGVTWVGNIDKLQLIHLLNEATVFVMPSYFEPWGHIFHEAMSYGVPCIGTTVCAMPEFIHDGENGALVPVGESAPLAQKLIAMLKEPDYAAKLGRKAYSTFTQEYTWKKIAGRIKPHLRSMSQLARDQTSGPA